MLLSSYLIRSKVCWWGTKVSFLPWMNRMFVMLLIFVISWILLNCSSKRELRKLILLYSTLLIDLYGLISISPNGLYIPAKWIAGPLPIDLPIRIISLSSIPIIFLSKNSYIHSESCVIYFDEGLNYLCFSFIELLISL